MNKLMGMALAVVIVATTATPSQAWLCCGSCAVECCAPCVQYQVTYVDKVIVCYKTEMREKEVTCTVMRCIPREVVEQRKICVMVPEMKQEKRIINVCRSVPREIERVVTCCKMVPVTCTDPCSGCCYTVCKPEYYTTKVKQIVCDLVTEQKEIVVNVCNYRPEERTIQVKRCVIDYKPETVVRKVYECFKVPYQTTIKVPVCTPVVCQPVTCCK
jgi:hypothetical protein